MPLDPLEITGGLAIGEGLGGAIADTVEPRLQNFKNDQWRQHPDKPLTPGAAAEVAAENYGSFGSMAGEASYSGLDAERFQNLYDITVTGPGMGELLAMLRRGTISGPNFVHGLQKARLEPMWHDPLEELQTVRLTPQQLALGIVRSTVDDPGLLVVTLDTGGSTIPKYPTWSGNALTEAAAGGIDKDRLRVMVGSVGLPMSPQQAASAAFRGIVNRAAFNLSILEGDIRPEYADAIYEQARQILTASEYAELQLRGYYDRATRLENTAKHGMSTADSDLLYDVQGRGLSLHAAFIAERRGGVFEGPTTEIPDWAMFQLQRGNLRPEVYNLAWAGRHTYPSPFVIRGLLTDGAISEADGEQIYLDIGWPDWLATTVANHYAGGSGAGADTDPHVAKAQNQLWTATHSSYVKDRTDDPTAQTKLAALGVPSTAISAVLALWQEERELVRAGLTPAQIKKAYTEGTFTQPEAVARLVELQWSAADATIYLGE